MSRIMGFIHDRLADAGHQVDYFCLDDVPVRWRGTIGRRFAFPFLVRRVAVEAARRGQAYDIVNVHEPQALPIATWKAAAGSPVVVVTSHGLERRAWELAKEEARLGRGSLPLKTRLNYPITSLWPAAEGLRRADHVFCLSSDDREYLVRWLRRSPDSITRIFPGADLEYARTARSYDGMTRVLFAGVWRKNKGIEDLVPAFIRLAERHSALTLIVAGAGVPDDVVRGAFPAAVRERIICETPKDERGMAAVFAGADLFLLPSLFEGTPLTLIQAMMSGLPIVTTATCGMKDVLVDGENGLLVPIRRPDAIVDAVGRLIARPELRARLGALARSDAASKYTWDRVSIPVRQVYETLCASPVSTPDA